MITIQTDAIKGLERKLKQLNKRGIAYATRQALNDGAFAARRHAVEDLDERFTVRNTWTARTINVQKTTSLVIGRQKAFTGSTQEYMARQQFGGTNDDSIPTSAASGEGRATTRRRVVRKQNRNNNLHAPKGRQGIPLPGRVRMAIADRTRVIKAGPGDPVRAGIYRIVGGTARNPFSARLNLIQAATPTPTKTRRNPWLTKAVDKTTPTMGALYQRALEFQIKRLR